MKTSIYQHKLLLEVSDTGIGISEENQKKIFDRFYREDTVRTRDKGGSGLGLSIAQWIVESHGGVVQVRSNKPKGILFSIILPKT